MTPPPCADDGLAVTCLRILRLGANMGMLRDLERTYQELWSWRVVSAIGTGVEGEQADVAVGAQIARIEAGLDGCSKGGSRT